MHIESCNLCRLPKDLVLQAKTIWQTRQPKASTVARYTAALKRAGAKFRAGMARSVRTAADTPRTVRTPSSQLMAQRPGHAGQPGSAIGPRSVASEPVPGVSGIATGSRTIDRLSSPTGEQWSQGFHSLKKQTSYGPSFLVRTAYHQTEMCGSSGNKVLLGTQHLALMSKKTLLPADAGNSTPLYNAADGLTAFSSGRPGLTSVSEDVEAPATVSSSESEAAYTAHDSSPDEQSSSYQSVRSSPESKRNSAEPLQRSHARTPSVSFDLISGGPSQGHGPSSGSVPARTAAWVDSSAASRGEPDQDEEGAGDGTDQSLLRSVFQAWRTAAANQHARRVHSNQNEVPLSESASRHTSPCLRRWPLL